MTAPLVIEHLDVIEQLHLGLAEAREAIGQLAFHRREEAFHDGVVGSLATDCDADCDVTPRFWPIVMGVAGFLLMCRMRPKSVGRIVISVTRHHHPSWFTASPVNRRV